MDGPLIALDVSKGSSHVQGFKSLNEPFGKTLRVKHSREGLGEVVRLAEKLGRETGEIPSAILESTGVYSECVVRFLQERRLRVYVISPLVSAKERKSEVRPTKTDGIDPFTIARVYYNGERKKNGKPKYRLSPEPIRGSWRDSLRECSAAYESESANLTSLKNQMHRYADLIWPGLCDGIGVCDPFGSVPMAVMRRLGHPEIAAKRSAKQLAKTIAAFSAASPEKSREKAEMLKEYARKAVSGASPSSPAVEELKYKAGEVLAKAKRLREIEKSMRAILASTHEYDNVLEMPCMQGVLGLRIVAEIGDWRRFPSDKELVAYAGLDPMVSESGRDDGRHKPITKKGNKRLRHLLYLAVKVTSANDPAGPIAECLRKKKGNGLSDKAAAVAASNKLLRIILSMLRSGAAFRHQ